MCVYMMCMALLRYLGFAGSPGYEKNKNKNSPRGKILGMAPVIHKPTQIILLTAHISHPGLKYLKLTTG